MQKSFSFRFSSVALLAFISFVSNAFALTDLERSWLAFQADPQTFMNMIPEKREVSGQSTLTSYFSKGDISSHRFVEIKSLEHPTQRPLTNVVSETSPIPLQLFFNASGLNGIDLQPILSLQEMEDQKLQEAKLAKAPWSSSYWPMLKGGISRRYADPRFPDGGGWQFAYNYAHITAPLRKIFDRRAADPKSIDRLSPAEKYDLLLGDLSSTSQNYDYGYLAEYAWERAKAYYARHGKIESWVGICHGWARAALISERPLYAVDAKLADGKTSVRFYPDDLKALIAYLSAPSRRLTTDVGQRCRVRYPEKDPENGRVIDPKCADLNPADWHLAVVNTIAIAKRSFAIDATYDYEVWNHPVLSYKYRYFNPQTGQQVATLKEATVGLADFSNDKFKKYRSPLAAAFAGIEMEVNYVYMSDPAQDPNEARLKPNVRSVTYMYDLEFDAKGSVIGGEWYTNLHPDFMWTLTEWKPVTSFGDSRIKDEGSTWTPDQPLPPFWREVGIMNAADQGEPLASILDVLLEASRKSKPKK